MFFSLLSPGQTDSQVDTSFSATCVRLAFRLATHLRGLALTLVELKFVRKSTQVFTVWPTNASRHKLIASQLYMREIYGFLRLVNPFGHPSQVRTQVLVL